MQGFQNNIFDAQIFPIQFLLSKANDSTLPTKVSQKINYHGFLS